MKLIRPNCRIQFTSEDVDFIISILARDEGTSQYLTRLLSDEDSRDLILDDEALFHAFLEHRGCLRVSSHLYFYVLVRHVLRKAGIEDRVVADYVAEVLCEFSRMDGNKVCVRGEEKALDYMFEMLAALQDADDRTRFCIRAHIGNHSLFFTGVFLERIRHRAEVRGFPDVNYYEELGRSSYRVASDHRLADEYELTPVFATLAERFQPTRLALNDVAQRLFSLGDTDYTLDALLNQFRD